jgi:hypothetical protein
MMVKHVETLYKVSHPVLANLSSVSFLSGLSTATVGVSNQYLDQGRLIKYLYTSSITYSFHGT